MELKDYTEEQLRAELKRRYDERQKERVSIRRCRHCEYMQRFKDYDLYNCRVRTFTRKNSFDRNNPIVVHYSVKKSDKACDKFKQGDFGQYDPVTKVIQIAKTSRGRGVPQSSQQQIFLHELVHAILNTMRKDGLCDDESFVNTFASFLNEAINTMK